MTKNDIAYEVEEMTGIKPILVKRVIDAVAQIGQEEIADGNDFSVPGLVKITYRYTAPRKKGEMYKKGETYVGFGGAEQTAESDSAARPAKIRLVATPAAPVKQHMPAAKDKAAQTAFLKSKVGKNIANRKSQ